MKVLYSSVCRCKTTQFLSVFPIKCQWKKYTFTKNCMYMKATWPDLPILLENISLFIIENFGKVILLRCLVPETDMDPFNLVFYTIRKYSNKTKHFTKYFLGCYEGLCGDASNVCCCFCSLIHCTLCWSQLEYQI